MQVGISFTSKLFVNETHTAQAVGSGDMPVLATPIMVALMENAAMNAVAKEIDEHSSTVGIEINTSHIKASPVGATIEATATLQSIEGRRLTFHVVAKENDTIIGEGTHLRFIVDKERFLSKLK